MHSPVVTIQIPFNSCFSHVIDHVIGSNSIKIEKPLEVLFYSLKESVPGIDQWSMHFPVVTIQIPFNSCFSHVIDDVIGSNSIKIQKPLPATLCVMLKSPNFLKQSS